jgi:hypothetical protein
VESLLLNSWLVQDALTIVQVELLEIQQRINAKIVLTHVLLVPVPHSVHRVKNSTQVKMPQPSLNLKMVNAKFLVHLIHLLILTTFALLDQAIETIVPKNQIFVQNELLLLY